MMDLASGNAASVVDEDSDVWRFPEFVRGSDVITEKLLNYDDEFRLGIGKEYIAEDIYIWYGRFQSRSPRPMPISNSTAHVQMFFCLGKNIAYFSGYGRQFVKFKTYQHNLMLIPEGDIAVQWRPFEENEAFAINVSAEFFLTNLADGHPLKVRFQEAVQEKLPALFIQQNLPMSPKIASILFEILNCDYKPSHKELFVKAKVMELMALQLAQGEVQPSQSSLHVLSEDDREKMLQAKDILVSNLEAPLSLKDLAHQVGTNEFNLKKNFKLLFGDTVFGYLHTVRMEKAKELLCDEEVKIRDIAQTIGYKHATHFTTAFKKYYGCLPTKIKLV
jgi:AraC-like DNA-binding protein